MSPATPDKPRRKAFSFNSDGKRRPTVEFDLNSEVGIRCVPELDGLTLLEFADLAGGLDGDTEDMTAADAAKGAGAIKSLLTKAIVPDDWERFEKAVRDPEHTVAIEGLADIAMWLVEQYTDRPTE